MGEGFPEEGVEEEREQKYCSQCVQNSVFKNSSC